MTCSAPDPTTYHERKSNRAIQAAVRKKFDDGLRVGCISPMPALPDSVRYELLPVELVYRKLGHHGLRSAPLTEIDVWLNQKLLAVAMECVLGIVVRKTLRRCHAPGSLVAVWSTIFPFRDCFGRLLGVPCLFVEFWLRLTDADSLARTAHGKAPPSSQAFPKNQSRSEN